MDYYSLSRKELQALCKKHGIRANTTNAEMADALQSLNIAQDSETEVRICDAMILENAGLNSPASVTTSCRRTPFRTSTRSMVRTSRSKRESVKAEEEEPKSPTAGRIENLEEASRSVALTGRRITTRSSARKQMEKVELAEELITPAKAVATLVPNSGRRPTRDSARQQTIREGAVQEEAERKEVSEKLKTPSFSSMICTRRSSRLRGKNQDSEANHWEQKLEKKFIDEKCMQQPDAAAGPDQEISEEVPCEPFVTFQETHAPVSSEYKEPAGKTMTEVLSINETTSLLKQSDQNDKAVGECLIPLCSDEKTRDIPATTETHVASSEFSDLPSQPEAPADAADKVIIDDISASSSPDSDQGFIHGEECNAPFPSLTDAHGDFPPSEADQVAVTSHEASIGAVMLSAEVSDGDRLFDQKTEILADLEPENNDDFAQETSRNPVEPKNNISESLSSGKDFDNIPATDEVFQFPGAAVTNHAASADAIVLHVKASDEAQVDSQTTEGVANLEKEKLHQADAVEAGGGFIAQEARLSPVQLLHSEPENDVGEVLISDIKCDNIPAIDEVLQFSGTASVEAQEDGFIAEGASLNHVLPSEPENNVGEVSFSGTSSDDVPATNEVLQFVGIAPVEAQEVPSAADGYIAQETSLNPVYLQPSEPENNVGEVLFSGINCDNVSATDEVLGVPGTALMGAQEIPSADVHHQTSAASSILDEFSGDLQQIEEVNEKSPSLGSWCTSPLPASQVVASPGSKLFMVPAADKSLQFSGVAPKDVREAHSENTSHESLPIDLITTTTAVPEKVSGAFQHIEGSNEKSPSFGSWSPKSPCSEFSVVRKPGKSGSSIDSSRGKTLARIRMFTTTVESCVDTENKSMNEEDIVVDKMNGKNADLVEFENYSLRKLRSLVKERIKNKAQVFQHIEGSNEKSPSFSSWSVKSPCSEFSVVRKSGKSRSSIDSSRGKTLARIRMFTTVEASVDKENKSMNEENIVVDNMNDKNAGLTEFENYSLRKLRSLVKEGIKNKVQMNERIPLEILSANCLLGNENRETA